MVNWRDATESNGCNSPMAINGSTTHIPRHSPAIAIRRQNKPLPVIDDSVFNMRVVPASWRNEIGGVHTEHDVNSPVNCAIFHRIIWHQRGGAHGTLGDYPLWMNQFLVQRPG